MKLNHSIRHLGLGLLTIAGVLCTAVESRADFAFHIDIDTSSLVGNALGDFSLDLQLSRGNGLNNAVTLSNFTYAGGSATNTPTITGNASGDIGSGVVLNDSMPINDLYQTYSGGTTEISFDVFTTTNPSGGVPDLFTVSVLDNMLENIQTTSPGVGTPAETDYLIALAIDAAEGVGSVETYTSSVAYSPTPGVTVSVSPVPEPRSVESLLIGGVALYMARRRERAICG